MPGMRTDPQAPVTLPADDDGGIVSRELAGALAHLARHMVTGCPRAGSLAALLLARIAAKPEADGHLRRHAADLAELLEREDGHAAGTFHRGGGLGRRPAVRP